MPAIEILQGEEKSINLKLRDKNDDPVTLTGADIAVRFKHTDTGRVIIRRNFGIDFADAAVDTTNDRITYTNHGLVSGDKIRLSNAGGGLPGGLASATDYYVVEYSKDAFQLAATLGGAAIDITSASGGGTHTLTQQDGIALSGSALLGVITVTLHELASALLRKGLNDLEVEWTISTVTRIKLLTKAVSVLERLS